MRGKKAQVIPVQNENGKRIKYLEKLRDRETFDESTNYNVLRESR